MELVVLILGTYALTVVLSETDGPFGVFYRLRKVEWLGALQCFTCCSVYVSAALSLLVSSNVFEWLLFTLAGAGGAIIISKIGDQSG